MKAALAVLLAATVLLHGLQLPAAEADAAALRAAWAHLYDDLPTAVDPPQTQELLGRFRMVNWGAANSGDVGEYPTAEAAAQRAADIRSTGATVAIVRGRHFRLDWPQDTPRLLECYRLAAAACHAQGLACLAHFDLTLTWQPGFALLKQNAQWPQRSLRDGTPTRWLCCNHPDLRAFYAGYVEQVARQGIDGFMLDEINFASIGDLHCGCQHCREKFLQKTGFRLPEYDDREVIGNPAHPLWRLWQEWQMYALSEFRGFLLQRLRAVNPQIVILTYSTNIESPSESPNDTFENARVCYAGTEGSNLTWGGSVNLFAQHRISLANSRFFGRPTWAQYPAGNDEERTFASLGFAPLTGNGPWGWIDPAQHEALEKSGRWAHVEESLAAAEPLADVGVLWSSSNRYGPPQRAAACCAEACGWMQALGLSGIQFNPVPGKYAQVEHLRPYRALIVPDALMLPTATGEAVRQFVEQGGTAVLSGEVGSRDVLYLPAGQQALAQRLGLRRVEAAGEIGFDRKKATFLGTAEHQIRLEPGFLPDLPRSIVLPDTYRFAVTLPASAEVLARFADGQPAVGAWRQGKGRCLYLAVLPGKAAFQPRASQTTLARNWHPPRVLSLVRALAQEATGGADRIAVEGQGILSSAWQHGSRAWLRMANVAGLERLPPGKPIAKAVPSYPDLEPIRIRVRMPLSAAPLLLSAESDKPLAMSVVGQGADWRLEIPPASFRLSAFVRLEVKP